MLSSDEVVDLWSALTRTIKGMVLSIPGRIQEKLPHLPFEDVEAIRKVTHKALTETSRDLLLADWAEKNIVVPDGPGHPDSFGLHGLTARPAWPRS